MKHCFLLIALVCGIVLPQTIKAQAQEKNTWRIMSYNIRNAKGMDNVIDYDRVADVINRTLPDIVTLQEIDSMTMRSGQTFVLQELAKRCLMHPVYAPAIDYDGGKYGIGLLSKEKPVSSWYLPLPGREEKRALLMVEFKAFIVGCTHFSLTEEDRLASIAILKGEARKSSKPFIITGDLNAEPESPVIASLLEDFDLLSDSKKATFPSGEPTVCIDYIALTKKDADRIARLSSQVIDEPMASDHRPVIADIRLRAEKEAIFYNQPYLQNPVIRGDLADPSVLRIEKTYYLTATSSEWAPFYPVYTSSDLVNWTQTGHIFDKQPDWTSSSFWAPELFYHNNTVYCYYTARRKTDNVSYIGVATADAPTGPYTDHGLLVEYGTEAIDAFVYDDNGQLYISWKAYGLDKRPIEIIASKLSPDGLRLEGEPFTLLRDDEGIGMEGQYHFKHGDYYYIIYSPHGCCGPRSDYDVYAARSKSFAGPYEKYEKNPILHGDGKEFISCGHGTATTTPDGRMFYICHGYLAGNDFYGGRQPILHEMIVGDDGWVHFTEGNIAKVRQPMPFPGTVQQPPQDIEGEYGFWTWNYVYAEPDFDIDNDRITLTGKNKEGAGNGTVLCVRPQSADYEYEVVVSNPNDSFKGLAFYGDDKNLVALGLKGDKLYVYIIKDGEKTVVEELAYDSQNHLKIKVSEGCHCSFYRSNKDNQWTQIGSEPMDCSSLVRWDRVARPGLIHNGDANQPAEFMHFKLRNTK